MGLALRTTPYGPPAVAAVRELVAGAQGGDVLRPVTVVVPTNFVGLALRRALATGAGVAGVAFLTPYRMAELLGAARLAAVHRRPVSTAVIGAYVRSVLDDDPGIFAPVQHHPSTEAALVRAHHELSDCSVRALDTLAARGRRAAEVVRVHTEARHRLTSAWYEERDLVAAAIDAVADHDPVLGELGSVVVYLPQDLSRPAAELIRAVAGATEVTAVVGLTGRDEADAPVVAAVGRLGLAVSSEELARIDEPHGTEVVSVADADDEVRVAVRRLLRWMREGVPLDRMAVLYGADSPYARLLHEHLDAAGIRHNGGALRTLADSLAGRTLQELLALGDGGFRRRDVCALLASSPVLDRGGNRVPAAAWERITRGAGVVRGIDDWRARLDVHAADLQRQVAEVGNDEEGDRRRARYGRELDDTRALLAFVEDLAAAVAVDDLPPTWAGYTAWARGLLARYLGDDRARRAWPDDELDAWVRVEGVLARLACLDDVRPPARIEEFRRALTEELAVDTRRIGRFGDGVFTGAVGLGLGLDLDRLVVLGLAEGTFPTRRRDDSLLPDADRRELGGELPLRTARVHDDQRDLLAALGAATGDRVCCFPRGDLRRSVERMPSRFLLDTVEKLNGGVRCFADDLARLDVPWFTVAASFASGIAHLDFPATVQEYDLCSLGDHVAAGRPLSDHDLARSDPAFAAGLALLEGRRSGRFTRFDGNLGDRGDLALPAVADGTFVVSPSRLQDWAACPHAYFVHHVLGVEPVEEPEELFEISALDRGSLVHDILDRFLSEVARRPTAARPPDRPWDDTDRARLREIAAATCDEFAAHGVPGRRLLWNRARAGILDDLDAFLDHDAAARAERGLETIATEFAFGFDPAGPPPVAIDIGDGRTLRVRGRADRVDRARDGGLVIFDYKTGRADSYRGLGERDPDRCGTLLQLPVYAWAARETFAGGDPGTDVRAGYWFVTTRGRFKLLDLPLSPPVVARITHVLRVISDGIAGGVFVAHPPTDDRFGGSCSYCDPDGLGARDLRRAWERKRSDPALAGYVALADPEDAA